jgi:iron(III) transport system ATP-binding protein
MSARAPRPMTGTTRADPHSRSGAAPVVALHGVHCRIEAQQIVRGVSFQLAAGQLGCLLGPSGCGKTTLLRAIAGFQPVSEGYIELRGRTVSSPRATDTPESRRVGFVFQDLALFPHLDVEANVGFGLHALDRAARLHRVRETLALLGLEEFGARYPHELSGGQQQRVALARSLAPRPDLLLLDEPFSSLDAHLRASLRFELRRVLGQLGMAALLVTHDQDEAFAFAQHIGVMQAGRLEQWDAPFEVYHRPATPFVARFVGEGRFLRARAREDGGIDCALGPLRAPSSPRFAPGTILKVLVRPDDVQPDGPGGIAADVVTAEFRGAENFFTLRLANGEEIAALFPSHQQHAPGDALKIRLDLEHVVAFEGD